MKIAIAGTGCVCLSSGKHGEMVLVGIANPFLGYASNCLPKNTKPSRAYCGEVPSQPLKFTVDASCTGTNFIADSIRVVPKPAMCSVPV